MSKASFLAKICSLLVSSPSRSSSPRRCSRTFSISSSSQRFCSSIFCSTTDHLNAIIYILNICSISLEFIHQMLLSKVELNSRFTFELYVNSLGTCPWKEPMHCSKINNTKHIPIPGWEGIWAANWTCWYKLLKPTLSHKETIIQVFQTSVKLLNTTAEQTDLKIIFYCWVIAAGGVWWKGAGFLFSVSTHLLFL